MYVEMKNKEGKFLHLSNGDVMRTLTIGYDVVDSDPEYFTIAKVRGEEIVEVRKIVGMSAYRLAWLCQWPLLWQRGFERPGLKEIPLYYVLAMIRVLCPGKTIGEQVWK